MGERLVATFTVTVGSFTFTNGNAPANLEQPISLEICHRDNEASRLTLTVKDFNVESDLPFEIFNAIPNPRLNERIPVVAIIGWEDEAPVRAFEGILVAKKMSYQPSRCELVALHESFRLRKRGRNDTKQNITLREWIIAKFGEENILATFHSSVAGDPALNTPIEAILQPGDTQWEHVRRWLRANGYLANTIRANEIVIRNDKADGTVLKVRRGDEKIVSLHLRQEQKRAGKSGRRKGHTHEVKPGRKWHRRHGVNLSRHVEPVQPPIGKTADRHHKVPLANETIRLRSKRRTKEGDELNLVVRLEPWMRNEERVTVEDFGSQISATYEVLSVVHRLGDGPARTTIEAWLP